MTSYFRRIVQALDAWIGRVFDVAKRSLERAAVSNTVSTLLLATVGLLAGLSFWQSPQAWLEPIRKQADRVARLYRALSDYGTALLDHAARDPVIGAILSVVLHPLFIRFAVLLLVLHLVYLWIRDEKAASAHLRQMVARQSLKLTGPERVHLFAHRLASVVVLVLLIFPGLVILFADPFIVLVFVLVLVAIYAAIRLVGWVIAALFE